MIRKHLRRDERGASSVEMALTLPILVVLIYGVFQVGAVMAADAGMQHGLGEGARMATLYPTPTDTAISDKITAKTFSVKVGAFTAPVITTGCAGKCKVLSISYSVTPNFLFFNGPAINMTRDKTVYLTV